ncbi:probable E3 ubiquitin-protein ligase HERC3 [Rhincodon typus]|uniref:probable E3 ubiquitin-protein ligase HERC3 n=1 Tax=Rhincodon typus TaxID=259920 RepID=UPI00202F0E5C|nr:probable E3 ubiquitin-protein ligase HERC3 [Rhincodon typus]
MLNLLICHFCFLFLSELNAIFSSPASLNGSFLDHRNDEHFKTSPRNPGIDLKAAMLFFEKMVNSPYAKLLHQVTVTLENHLISQLPTSPPDVEAMRAFLILPVLPLFRESKNYLTFALPFAAAILHLDANPSKVLDNWWCWVDAGYFCQLVELYKDAVVYLLTRMRTSLLAPVFSHYIIDALRVLEKLHKVNLIANHIDYEVFYIHELNNFVNIETDFLYWASQHAGVKIQPAIAEVPIAFCSYPFVLNAQAKTKMLQTEAALQMQIAVNRTSLENIFMLLTLGPFLTSSPFLVLHVQRTNLVSDALRELSIHSDVDLKKPLKVVFLGEEAVDDGGVTKEFFLLLLKELLDPKYGMFTYYEQSRLLWFSEKTFVELNWFHLIGILCGLAIYNFTVVDLRFPLVLYKKLLSVKPTLEDLKELSPTEGSFCFTGQVMALSTEEVVHVACGKHHTLALCQNGSVFGWGAGTYGQLGNGRCCGIVPHPRRAELTGVPIVQVTCGRFHSLALSKDGAVYSWGQNTYGQLGLGKDVYSQIRPQHIISLTGIPVAQIAAGGRHSFVLSLSGAVFSWGRNNHGQLGLKSTMDKVSPCHVKQMKELRVTYISCGNQHTALLTKNGSVFTCGEGRAGQLGLSTKADVNAFQKVDQIKDEVSQIACGSYHTLAYIPSSDLVVSFGFAINGKLEESSTNNHIHAESQNAKIYKIFAGANANFILTQCPMPAADFRCRDSAQQILTLSEAIVNKWINTADYSKERDEAKKEIEIVFSSSSCVTGSFLKQSDGDQPETGTDLLSVDVEAARELFRKLTRKDWIVKTIIPVLARCLIPNLKNLCHDKEALMIYLILPESSLMQYNETMEDMLSIYVGAIERLNDASKNILKNCWSTLKSSYLNNLVQTFRAAVVILLTNLHALYIELPGHPSINVLEKSLREALDVLELAYHANMKAQHKIPQNKFYIDEVLLFDVGFEVIRFKEHQLRPNGLEEKKVPLCCYPFIFNLNAKIQILHMNSVLEKTKAFVEAMNFTCRNICMGNPEHPKYPIFKLNVNRQDLVTDTFKKLIQVDEEDLRKELKVKFDGEPDEDLGAIRQEFFLFLFRELIQPDSRMFIYSEDFRIIWFPPEISVPIKNYHLLGILCGLVVYNFSVVYIPFPLALFKKILGMMPTLEDLQELQPSLEKILQHILDNDEDLDVDINFSIIWENKEVELIPNGRDQPVMKENKEEYVNACVNYIFTASVKEPFDAFRRGFYKVCDKTLLKFFQPRELMDILIGNDDYDWNMLEKNTTYSGNYSRSHPTIEIFWKVFHELSLAEKKKFLLFLTGNDRLPVMGMVRVNMHIIWSPLSEDNYPEADVCFSNLRLPEYSSIEILKKQLLTAINTKERFDKL